MWVEFVGHAIPRNRGKVFGLSTLIGGFFSIGISSLVTVLLDTYPYPQAISGAAAIAFAGSLISFVAILTWHEAVHPDTVNMTGAVVQEDGFFRNLKITPIYQKYLMWRGVVTAVEMALPFLTISAITNLKIPDSQVGVFTIVLSIAHPITNLFWGWLGDRIGFLKILVISTILGSLGIFLAASTESLSVFYLIFVCAGAMLSGQQLTNINIIYEFSKKDQIPTYTAIQQMVISPISGLMPVIGGMLVNTFGYSALFNIAGFLGLTGSLGMFTKVENQFHSTQSSELKTDAKRTQ
jgi:MFS family permease